MPEPCVLLSYQGGLSMTARSHPVFLMAQELADMGVMVPVLLPRQPDRKSPAWNELSQRKNIFIYEMPGWMENLGKLWHPFAKATHVIVHALREKVSLSQARAYLTCHDHFYCSYLLWKRQLDQLNRKFHPDAIIS